MFATFLTFFDYVQDIPWSDRFLSLRSTDILLQAQFDELSLSSREPRYFFRKIGDHEEKCGTDEASERALYESLSVHPAEDVQRVAYR